jgi:ABC-type transporter Mla subunit MlaD
MKSQKNLAWIGFVTLTLFSMLVALILWKNSIFTKVQSYELIGEFNSINGLLNNAVVKYRGYPVGRVTNIIPNQKNIEVFFFIHDDYAVPAGSTLKIVFDGLVGEKYMEIIPNPNAKKNYSDGDRIPGYSTAGLSDFIDVGTQNLMELKSILKTMSAVFGNEEISTALRDVVFSMRAAAENMEEVINEMRKISGSEKIGRIVTQMDILLTNINKALNEKDLQKINATISNLEIFSVELKELVSDGELKASILETFKGTQTTFKQSSNFLNTISSIELLTSADFQYNKGSNGTLLYLLNFNFWLHNTYLNFGFSNYVDNQDSLVNVLLNVPYNDSIRLHYGLIRSKPGVGFLFSFEGLPLSTGMSLYDFGSPYLDASVHYKIFSSIWLKSGFYELNKDTRSFFFGVSFFSD